MNLNVKGYKLIFLRVMNKVENRQEQSDRLSRLMIFFDFTAGGWARILGIRGRDAHAGAGKEFSQKNKAHGNTSFSSDVFSILRSNCKLTYHLSKLLK